MTSAKIYKSTRDKKKYMVVFEYKDGRKKTIHFGARGSDDYTITGDKEQRRRYIDRHDNPREDWSKPDNAGSLARFILWGDTTSVKKNFELFKKKFKLS
jgi:hypothetical protein